MIVPSVHGGCTGGLFTPYQLINVIFLESIFKVGLVNIADFFLCIWCIILLLFCYFLFQAFSLVLILKTTGLNQVNAELKLKEYTRNQ